MTVINIISAAVYLKGFAIRDKIQTYALAIIFLVLLYNSPSALVCYWILNNLFSLAKNIVNAKCKHPARFVFVCLYAMLVSGGLFVLFVRTPHDFSKRVAVAMLTLFVSISPLYFLYAKRIQKKAKTIDLKNTNDGLPLFLASALGIALLCGLVLPSSVIATSPIEFSFVGNTASPFSYVLRCAAVFFGFFIFWPLCIYKMFGSKIRSIMPYVFAFLFIAALLNVYVFKSDYGNINIFFHLENLKVLRVYNAFFIMFPAISSIFIIFLLYLIEKMRLKKQAALFMLAVCTAEVCFSFLKIKVIQDTYKKYAISLKENTQISKESDIKPVYHLSKTGKNVVVLFLDAAVGAFFPYITQQFPDLIETFSGFVYYPNTLSFSRSTAKASPAMLGGYEYTPENENKRPDELLRIKHNEAMLVMPKLFFDAGFDVTVTDPPYSNYSWRGDSSPFKKFPGISCDFFEEAYYDRYRRKMAEDGESNNIEPDVMVSKYIVGFCAMQASPPFLRSTIYNGSYYLQCNFSTPCICLAQFAQLYYLGDSTDCESKKDSFIFIGNDTTHEAAVLKEPEYIPADNVDIKSATTGFYNWKTERDIAHYHVNTAAMLQVARWIKHLKEMNVYDNTRIIIVADHGRNVSIDAFKGFDGASFNPLLLVKDFNAQGNIKTDNTLMTNADTVFLAKKGLAISDTNPFTGKNMESVIDKSEVHIFPIVSKRTNQMIYLRKQKIWDLTGYCVRGNIFDSANWTSIKLN